MKASMGFQNRTGAYSAPDLLDEMVAGTHEFPPSSDGDATAIAQVRVEYARAAEPLGTMPPPATVAGLAKTALRALAGGKPSLLLDKLGERLAFERAGTRLYDALLSKHDVGRTFRGGPSRAELEHIRNEEHQHFLMLLEAVERLGGDPTAVTPSANVHATASMGLPAVLADPRTDLLQCLEAILVAELVDNECWPGLIELVSNAGATDLVARFEEAVEHEREHLAMVRTWVAVGSSRAPARANAAGARRDRQSAPSAKASKRGKGSRKSAVQRGGRRRAKTGSSRKRRAR